jgi:CRP/FNR family transcriptional regulator, cyclic AMP receptor protein
MLAAANFAHAPQSLLLGGRAFTAAAHEPVFDVGSPGERIYALKLGRVLIYSITRLGREINYSIINPGEFFGFAALADKPRAEVVSAVALNDCEVIAIERDRLLETLRCDPVFMNSLFANLVDRLQERTQQLADLALLGLSPRLAKWLLELGAKSGAVEKANAMRVEFSQKVIATFLGVGREAINRKLREWEDDGIITLHSSDIRINDVKTLRRLIEQDGVAKN